MVVVLSIVVVLFLFVFILVGWRIHELDVAIARLTNQYVSDHRRLYNRVSAIEKELDTDREEKGKA